MSVESQHIQQQGVTFDGVLKAGYDLNYTYGSKPHQIDNIKDENYRTEANDAKKLKKTENVYEYDLNGNLIFVSKNKKKDEKQNERKLLWDEENRLEAVSDNGYVSLYTYDAGGERVAKLSGNGESVYVNSKNAGKRTQTNRYTAYISPYFVLSSGGQYTKHIMIGSQRIVSKLGDVGSFGQDPRRIEYAGTTESIKIDHKAKYTASQRIIKEKYKRLKVVYNGVDNNDYRGGESFCCGKKKKDGFGARGGITNNDKPELYQYYYHPDHLGSSSYITNLDGEVAQHIEYVPFGEVFLNEQNNRWNTPYLFNGKELDEETGLYYYGARYYNPRESVWLSVDPLAEETMTPYQYTYQNPVKFIDPTGMSGEDWEPDGKGGYTAKKGDSAYTLARDANIINEQADALVQKQLGANYKGKDGGIKSNVKIGDKVVVPSQVERYAKNEGSVNPNNSFVSLESKSITSVSNNDTAIKTGEFTGFSMGGAFGGGLSLELGMVSDSKGSKAVYFCFGGNCGLGGGYGFKGGTIVPNGDHSFLVDDFKGKGNSWSVGLGPFGYEKGGSQGNGFSDYGNSTEKNKRPYKFHNVGYSKGGRAGATISETKTWILKLK